MLDFHFGPRNPTRLWNRLVNVPLVFDLDAATLNAVGLGHGLESLAFLGPAGRTKSFWNDELCWFSQGVSARFNLEHRRIVEIRIVHSDPFERRFRPFRGTVVFNCREVDLATLSVEQFIAEYGDSYWRDCDQDESILFYEFPGLEWQIEFDLNSRGRCITVTREPIMSNEEQRKAYGVTKPWPPARSS